TLRADSFFEMLLARDSVPTFHPGVYRLQLEMTSEAALKALQDPQNRLQGTVALPEGLTVDVTVERISQALELPLEEVKAAVEDPSAYGVSAKTLEGWLFPAVYQFNPGVTAEEVIERMVERTRQALDQAGVEASERHRILTIAS